MKKLIIFLIFLSGHFLSRSQTFVEEGTKDTITISQSVRTRTVIDTAVTVTRKKYNPPPVVVQPPTQPEVPPPSSVYDGYRKILAAGFNTSAEIPTTQGPRNRLSTDIKTEGSGSFRSEVRASDQSTSSGYRSEIQYSSSKYKPVEGILEYDVYYENWRSFGGGGHTIQWHPDNGTGSATLCLYAYNGKFQVVRNLGSKYDGANYYQSGTLMSITANKWYKLRWEFKWATSGGYIRLYIDGKLYYSYSGETMNSSTGMPYLKLGQNRWNMNSGTNTVIYYDNMQLYEKLTFTGLILGDSLYFSGQTINPIEQWKLRINSPNISCAVDHGDKPCPGYPNPAPVPSRIDTVPPAKTYQLELTESEANTLLYILNKGRLDGMSGEDATLVAILIQRVTGQLRKQATTK